MKPRKHLPSIFRAAARLQFENRDSHDNDTTSPYACDNIGHALYRAKKPDASYNGCPEHSFFEAQFRPTTYGGLGWWPKLDNGDHDHESRILALLLCAEMLKR